MAHAITIRRRAEFAETDLAGIVHFSNFFRWMEAAEAAFFESVDEPLFRVNHATVQGWPRVRAHCEYHGPVHFRDTIEIDLRVKAIKIKAVVFAYRFYVIRDDQSRDHVATGEMTTVLVERPLAGGAMRSLTLGDALLAKIEEAPGKQP
jgi:YbgC/YbaW family acyl-CoA thioester hydrolase